MNWPPPGELPAEPGFYFTSTESWPVRILADGTGDLYAYDKSGGVHRLTGKYFGDMQFCGPVILPEKPELKPT